MTHVSARVPRRVVACHVVGHVVRSATCHVVITWQSYLGYVEFFWVWSVVPAELSVLCSGYIEFIWLVVPAETSIICSGYVEFVWLVIPAESSVLCSSYVEFISLVVQTESSNLLSVTSNPFRDSSPVLSRITCVIR